MGRLTKKFNCRYGGADCFHSCSDCYGLECEDVMLMVDKLAHYEDMEDSLEKLYGGRLSLDTVVDNMNRIIQNGEEKLDFARILTNDEAEKYDKWKTLEEQGRLVELPCKVGDTVYVIDYEYGDIYVPSSKYQYVEARDFGYEMLDWMGEYCFLTEEEAEAKLTEMEGVK